MKQRLIVEIELDKEPATDSEVDELLADIAENYARTRIGFVPRTGPAFVSGVRRVSLSPRTAEDAVNVLSAERERLQRIADSSTAGGEVQRLTRDRIGRLRTAAAFVTRLVRTV